MTKEKIFDDMAIAIIQFLHTDNGYLEWEGYSEHGIHIHMEMFVSTRGNKLYKIYIDPKGSDSRVCYFSAKRMENDAKWCLKELVDELYEVAARLGLI